MNKISMDKKYKLRCGYPVRVLCVDLKDNVFPIVAAYEVCGEEGIMCCKEDGSAIIDTNFDLVEVSPWEDFKKDDKVMVRLLEDEE